VAALELGRRRKDALPQELPQVASSKDAHQAIKAELFDLPHEEFWLLILNRTNVVINKRLISRGGQSGTVVDPKIIFKAALELNAASIVLVHNHPSGNLKPSAADVSITKKMVELGKMMQIPIHDHLIVYNNTYLSMADEEFI
jgi:DNA repair protein RadC